METKIIGMNKKIAQLYKGKYEELNIVFSRVWARPSAWIFTIHPIKVLLDKYVGDGIGTVEKKLANFCSLKGHRFSKEKARCLT